MSKVITNVRKSYYAAMTDMKTEQYGEVKELGDLIEISIQPKEESTEIYAGGKLYDSVTSFKNVEATLTVPETTVEQMIDLFGKKKAEGGGYIDNAYDRRPFVCIMAERERADGTMEYLTLYKCKLELNEEKGKTSEGKTDFQTKQFKLTAMPLKDGMWKYIVANDDPDFNKETFATKWGKEVIKANVKTETK